LLMAMSAELFGVPLPSIFDPALRLVGPADPSPERGHD
jgi:hypothetical protein